MKNKLESRFFEELGKELNGTVEEAIEHPANLKIIDVKPDKRGLMVAKCQRFYTVRLKTENGTQKVLHPAGHCIYIPLSKIKVEKVNEPEKA